MGSSLYKSFTDEATGKKYLLVESGLKASLWDMDEYTSYDLMQEVENWLRNHGPSDEAPLSYIQQYYEENYEDA